MSPDEPVRSGRRDPATYQKGHLLLFFERVYLPTKLPGRHPAYVNAFRTSIRWFGDSLGREALVCDLTASGLRVAIESLTRSGIGTHRLRSFRKQMLMLANHAHHLGLLPNIGDVDVPTVAPRCVSWDQEEPRPGTLLHGYRCVFRPAMVGSVSSKRRSQLDAAITRFHDFLGRLATVAEIDEGMLEDFRKWLFDQGLNPKYVVILRDGLRRVLRFLDPERFQPKPGGKALLLRGERQAKSIRVPDPEPGTVRHFFETAYRPNQLLGAVKTTIEQYRAMLRCLRDVCGSRDPMLTELNDRLASTLLEFLLKRGMRPVTVNQYRGSLLAVWRYAYDGRLVSELPRVRKLKEHREEPDAWSEEEARRIIRATDSLNYLRGPIGGIPAGRWWRGLLLVGYWTALRRGSLLKIRRSDVDLESGWLSIPPDHMKNRRGKRFRLGADAIAAIRDIWLPEREYLFPYRKTNTNRHFALLLDLAGVPKSQRRSTSQLHKWRRTVATLVAVKAGLPAAIALLGHSGAEVTRRYIDPTRLPGNDATGILPALGE